MKPWVQPPGSQMNQPINRSIDQLINRSVNIACLCRNSYVYLICFGHKPFLEYPPVLDVEPCTRRAPVTREGIRGGKGWSYKVELLLSVHPGAGLRASLFVSIHLQSRSGPSDGFLRLVLRELMVRRPLPAGTISCVCTWGDGWSWPPKPKPDSSQSFLGYD